MPSRVERYENNSKIKKRINKNQELYQDLKRNTNYKEVSAIEPVIERENFDLQNLKEEKKSRTQRVVQDSSEEIISSLLMIDEKKEHDINKILIEAKKTRTHPDELEEKRKLKKEEYNITSQVDVRDLDHLKEMRKKSGVREDEQEEIKEIIDTIYSKKLKEEIDDKLKESEEQTGEDLMSDLLPTSSEETIINASLNKELLEKEQERKEAKGKIENSFFTKSMDLSTEDLEEEEEEELFLDEKKLPIWVVVLICLVVVAILAVVGYFVYNSII